MDFKIKRSFANSDVIIVAGFEREGIIADISKLGPEVESFTQALKKDKTWEWGFGNFRSVDIAKGKGFKKVLLLGLGKKKELNDDKLKKAVAKILRSIKFPGKPMVAIILDSINSHDNLQSTVYAIAESAYLTTYEFVKYNSDWKDKTIKEIQIITNRNSSLFDDVIRKAENVAKATNFARDLINEPANVITPVTLAEEAVKAGEEFGFETEIKTKETIKELGMKAYLQVAKGSVIPPMLIIMRYVGDPESDEILGLVGKGLTYDSGGYSIKPTSSMMNMKCDMGGAAAVIGAISAIASNKEKINVTAVVAACENMLSGSAYRPGDIIGSMGGKYIEVVNTDAEGRLTLIDAVTYAQQNEKVTKIIDIATLTGGAMVALGTVRSAVIANNDRFYKKLEKAADASGEKIWRMPADDEYKELIKSDIADLKNSGGRGASMVTAGLFVGEFIKDIPWMHIDIAGKALATKANYYHPKGGTAIGARLLYYLTKEL